MKSSSKRKRKRQRPPWGSLTCRILTRAEKSVCLSVCLYITRLVNSCFMVGLLHANSRYMLFVPLMSVDGTCSCRALRVVLAHNLYRDVTHFLSVSAVPKHNLAYTYLIRLKHAVLAWLRDSFAFSETFGGGRGRLHLSSHSSSL
jgi:hypothetical protein